MRVAALARLAAKKRRSILPFVDSGPSLEGHSRPGSDQDRVHAQGCHYTQRERGMHPGDRMTA